MEDDLFNDRPELEALEDRLRALGSRNPLCSHPACDEGDAFALRGVHPHLLCAEHLADTEARAWTEGHHVSGRANDPGDIRAIPANDHAVVSGRHQAQWPRDTLRNPDGSPLLRAAAQVRGWLDILRLILDRTVGWVPDLLEHLDAWLRERIAPRWWDDFLGEAGLR